MAEHTLFPSILPADDSNSDDPIDADDVQTVAEIFDAGDCPWCDEFDGQAPKQHAARSHADRYQDWKTTQDQEDG